jgi:uncharacterized protein (TIGR03086 family)
VPELDLRQFDRAGSALAGVLAKVDSNALDGPTPCSDWSLRELINHVVHGTAMFTGMVAGGAPPDGGADLIGDDPLGAFQRSLAGLRAAFTADGVAERTYSTPFGARPAARLVTTRVIEMSLHGWDIAKATGQTIDLGQDVVDICLATLRGMLPADRSGLPYGPEQPVPAGAAPVDRLAAFAGRKVQ